MIRGKKQSLNTSRTGRVRCNSITEEHFLLLSVPSPLALLQRRPLHFFIYFFFAPGLHTNQGKVKPRWVDFLSCLKTAHSFFPLAFVPSDKEQKDPADRVTGVDEVLEETVHYKGISLSCVSL